MKFEFESRRGRLKKTCRPKPAIFSLIECFYDDIFGAIREIMHELSVTESILNIATNHAIKAGASKVTDIHIVIGKLSSIVDESVQFYWDIISKDTICEASRLHFNYIEARFLCQECEKEFSIEREMLPCPYCGSINISILSGEEFYLESIEIVN
jgi:hydrogenase nickel incorporation protein HypA/HybF